MLQSSSPTSPILRLPKGDHAALAENLIQRFNEHGEAPVFCEENWHTWTGTHWRVRERHELKADMARSSSWAMWDDNSRIKPTDALASSVITLAQSLAYTPGFFEDVEPGVSFQNGFLRVTHRGAVLEPNDPNNRNRYSQPCEWNPDAQAPRWAEFLRSVWTSPKNAQPEDVVTDFEAREDFLARFVGLSLIGRAHVGQRACILKGNGANGKSILCDVVRDLFPRETVTSVPPQDLTKPERVATLAGKNLNLVSDIPEKGLPETGLLKQVISGDELGARRLYQNSFMFRPVAGNMFSANTIPRTQDFSEGFVRRWVILTFPASFRGEGARVSSELVHELLGERSGIMAWAIRGAVRFLSEGRYLIPPSSDKAVGAWRTVNDQVACFIDDSCEVLADFDPQRCAQAALLYATYRAWAQANGHHPLAIRGFNERLHQLGHRDRRQAYGREWTLALKREKQ